MFSSLRYRLIFGFTLIILLFSSGVMLTLAVVWNLGERTESLVNRHWESNLLVGKTHDLLSEITIFINQNPEQLADSAVSSLKLQQRISLLIGEFLEAEFQNDFQKDQIRNLQLLKEKLSGPIELLAAIEHHNELADAAMEELRNHPSSRKDEGLLHDLNVAALAYRDYRLTANPSDLEIFRQQLPRIAEQLDRLQLPAFEKFRNYGEQIFADRLRLRQTRQQILATITETANLLRNGSEIYLQDVVLPARVEVMSGLSNISTILLFAVIVSGISSLVVAIFLAKRLSTPMEEAVDVLSRIEKGDFTARFTAVDDAESEQLGHAINSLNESLHNALASQKETMERLIRNQLRFKEIAERRLELERIINASPTIVFFIRLTPDMSETVAFMSQSVRQLGYDPEEFLSGQRNLLSITPPDEARRIGVIFSHHLADPSSHNFSVDLRIIDSNGGIHSLDGRVLIQRDPSGVATGYQGVLVDETEKIHIREQAEKIGNLAALGELAAGVAHEINNPNAIILLNIAMLRDMGEGALKILDAQVRQHGEIMVGRLPYSRLREEFPRLLSEVADAAERTRRIVEDMKTFTRVNPDQSRQSISLNEIIESALRLARNILKNSTDRLQVELTADLPEISANRQQIEQVIVNLLINACQALTSRDNAIILRTFKNRGGSVCMTIRDEGRGIPPEHLPHVTDPFFTTRRERGGTGLGLSISARIVHDHHGKLTIDSPGHGTTVKISFPAAPCQELT